MIRHSVDWPWILTNLCLGSLLAHFLLIIGAGLLFPDWSGPAGALAIGLVCLAFVLFLVVVGLDYRASWGRARRRAPN